MYTRDDECRDRRGEQCDDGEMCIRDSLIPVPGMPKVAEKQFRVGRKSVYLLGKQGHEPVSYTHLDVYKRQVDDPEAAKSILESFVAETRLNAERLQKAVENWCILWSFKRPVPCNPFRI